MNEVMKGLKKMKSIIISLDASNRNDIKLFSVLGNISCQIVALKIKL